MIRNEAELLKLDVGKIEEHYDASYVCEACIRNGGEWRTAPSLIFYNRVAHPQGSNYFAVSFDRGGLVVTDGLSAVESGFTGIRADNGDIIYSRHRHDCRWSEDGSVMIDGGRDYFRCNDATRLVQLEVVDGVLRERIA